MASAAARLVRIKRAAVPNQYHFSVPDFIEIKSLCEAGSRVPIMKFAFKPKVV